MTLTDGRVGLRPPGDTDLPAILGQSVDPEVQRWTTVARHYTAADAAQFLDYARQQAAQPAGNVVWTITHDGAFAGLLDLRWQTPLSATVGYVLHPEHRGEGVAAAALRLAARHAFGPGPWGVPLRRLHWQAEVGNWASRRVAWACGFTVHARVPGELRHFDDRGEPDLRDAWLGSLGAQDALDPVAPWFDPVVLTATAPGGRRLRLRPWRDHDTPWLAPGPVEDAAEPAHWNPAGAILTEPVFGSWLTDRRTRMSQGQAVEWCIADAVTDQALGSVGVFVDEGVIHDTAEIGYQTVPQARGQGLATAAASAVVGFLRDPHDTPGLRPRRLVAQTAAENAASNRVLERTGFTCYGREPDADVLADGTTSDALHWHLRLR